MNQELQALKNRILKLSQNEGAGEVTANKDTSNGYAGLTLLKINFKNVLNTFTSFFTNSNTAARTYAFPDQSGTVELTVNKNAASGYAGLNSNNDIQFKESGGSIVSIITNVNSTSPRTYTFPDETGTVLLTAGTQAFAEGKNVACGTTTGTKIGTGVNQKLGFWNKTPIVQPASANQAALSLDVDVTGADTVDKAAINTNFTNIETLLNQLRTDLVNSGIIKGSA